MRSFQKLLAFGIRVGIALAVPSLSLADGHLHQFKISFCSTDGMKCLEVVGAEAKQGILAPIYSFKNGEVRIVNRKLSEQRNYSNVRGHLDFGSNQIVFLEVHNGRTVEKTFNLGTLEERTFLLE